MQQQLLTGFGRAWYGPPQKLHLLIATGVGPVCNLTALGRLSGDDEYVGDIEVEEDIDEEIKVDVSNVVQVCAVVLSATT